MPVSLSPLAGPLCRTPEFQRKSRGSQRRLARNPQARAVRSTSILALRAFLRSPVFFSVPGRASSAHAIAPQSSLTDGRLATRRACDTYSVKGEEATRNTRVSGVSACSLDRRAREACLATLATHADEALRHGHQCRYWTRNNGLAGVNRLMQVYRW
jgi:hypothetical protein